MRLNCIRVGICCVLYCIVSAFLPSPDKVLIQKKNIDGKWIIKSATIEGLGGKVALSVFDEADYSCFNGSTWKFNEADKTGEFVVPDSSVTCPGTRRQISWKLISSDKEVQRIEITKLSDNTSYSLQVVELGKEAMQLKYLITNITFSGQPIAVLYNFSRN